MFVVMVLNVFFSYFPFDRFLSLCPPPPHTHTHFDCTHFDCLTICTTVAIPCINLKVKLQDKNSKT